MATSASRIGGAAAANTAAPTIGANTSLRGLAATALRSARDIVARLVEIAALESRVAGLALVKMVIAAVVATLLAVTTWGLLIAAAVLGLVEFGLALGSALLLAAVVNAVVAGLLIAFLPRLARRLTFPVTRKMLEKIGPTSS
ncbi:MAG: hypothetical protein HY308_02160 [Gammaproteobacteria bacterium]|nr:hypothetical protein [Gammaproteobacteria bacterium]